MIRASSRPAQRHDDAGRGVRVFGGRRLRPGDPRAARGFRDVAPEAVLLGGAGAAILLQIADPRVAAGVAAHSDFVKNPLKRLWATLDYVYAVGLGDATLRAAQAEHVGRAHSVVRGEAADGLPAYDANDDDARTWVAMTLAFSGTRAWDAVLGPLPAPVQDRVLGGYGALASWLGVPAGEWFPDAAAFRAAWAERVGRLEVTPQARGVAAELLAARHAPLWLRALMPTARLATVALLPPPVRAAYGFTLSTAQDALWRGLVGGLGRVYPLLPPSARHFPATARLAAQRRALGNSRSSLRQKIYSHRTPGPIIGFGESLGMNT